MQAAQQENSCGLWPGKLFGNTASRPLPRSSQNSVPGRDGGAKTRAVTAAHRRGKFAPRDKARDRAGPEQLSKVSQRNGQGTVEFETSKMSGRRLHRFRARLAGAEGGFGLARQARAAARVSRRVMEWRDPFHAGESGERSGLTRGQMLTRRGSLGVGMKERRLDEQDVGA